MVAASQDRDQFIAYMEDLANEVADLRVSYEGYTLEERAAIARFLEYGIDKVRVMNKNLVHKHSPSVVGDKYR